MNTLTLPVSLLNSACIPPLGCDPPKARGRRRLDDLVLRAQAGDHDAFSKLYLENKRRVFEFACAWSRISRSPKTSPRKRFFKSTGEF